NVEAVWLGTLGLHERSAGGIQISKRRVGLAEIVEQLGELAASDGRQSSRFGFLREGGEQRVRRGDVLAGENERVVEPALVHRDHPLSVNGQDKVLLRMVAQVGR